MPEEVIDHLKMTRKLRLSVGFKHSRGHEIPIVTLDNQLIDIPEHEFVKRYGTNSISRRTDDIVWVLGWYSCWLVLRDDQLLREMVDTYEVFDSVLYCHLYDPSDGLYHGQAAFLDIGRTGYPEKLMRNRQLCTVIKSLSTNSLYHSAFRRLATACSILGLREKEEEFEKQAAAIKKSIRTSFYHPDGYYAYFIHPDGRLEPGMEQLGSAFSYLSGIVSEEESFRNLRDDHRNQYGAPVFYPFYHYTTGGHNNAIWPFADMIFNKARFTNELLNRDTVFFQSLASLSRHALKGSFHEYVRYSTGEVMGSPQYIWSNAAFISFVTDLLLGLAIDERGLTINPFVPEAFADLSLDNFRVGSMVLDIKVDGHGDSVRKLFINNVRYREPVIEIKPGEYTVRVVMRN
jgi:hypothetical protein